MPVLVSRDAHWARYSNPSNGVGGVRAPCSPVPHVVQLGNLLQHFPCLELGFSSKGSWTQVWCVSVPVGTLSRSRQCPPENECCESHHESVCLANSTVSDFRSVWGINMLYFWACWKGLKSFPQVFLLNSQSQLLRVKSWCHRKWFSKFKGTL